MKTLISSTLMILALSATTVLAQSDTSELSTGEAVAPQIGQAYPVQAYGLWQKACVKTAEGQSEPCHITQVITDDEGKPVAEVTFFRPNSPDIAAGANFVTPLGTLLTSQLVFAIDGKSPKRYPFNWCEQFGCFARVGFVPDELALLKSGSRGSIRIDSIVTPGQPIILTVDLANFTEAFDTLEPQ
ncbi:MAG: invasion protein IalB [Planctomycetota bacterium]|jgi:invasion protein IalB